VKIPRVCVSTPEWRPQPRCCYDNTRRYVELNPQYKEIRGWLVLDRRIIATLVGQQSFVELIAHSVVESSSGTLLDITPVVPDLESPHPFLKHLGTEDEFAPLIADYRGALQSPDLWRSFRALDLGNSGHGRKDRRATRDRLNLGWQRAILLQGYSDKDAGWKNEGRQLGQGSVRAASHCAIKALRAEGKSLRAISAILKDQGFKLSHEGVARVLVSQAGEA
jgi:hypothetical protein